MNKTAEQPLSPADIATRYAVGLKTVLAWIASGRTAGRERVPQPPRVGNPAEARPPRPLPGCVGGEQELADAPPVPRPVVSGAWTRM